MDVLKRNAHLPVWCLSRANIRLADELLSPSADNRIAATTYDGRDYTCDLLGLFEFLNVRYMQEMEQLPTAGACLDWVLRAWLRTSPRQATLGNLFGCLRLLQRTDILQRLNTRLFVEYYHLYLSYHPKDSDMAARLMADFRRLEPRWILLDSQLVAPQEFSPADVLQRCFSSILLVSPAYLANNRDYWRALMQDKFRNYPAFCIATDPTVMHNLPGGMRLFPTLTWNLLSVTPGFYEQVRKCVRNRGQMITQRHVVNSQD